MKKRFAITLVFFLVGMYSVAQYYNTGTDPFSTKWKQIKTDHFQIIFPEEFEDKAQEFANKMVYAYDFVAKSLPHKPRKLSVIIHSHSAQSNGLVAWAPRRMELWTTPSQSSTNYSQDWMDQLIIHETRHFVQENKMNQGFTKFLKILFGEQGEMIPLGAYTRQWFMEGDAVATETALSHSGRGRLPSFEQGLRTLTLEKGVQRYDQAHLGTYKYYIPDHYEVGYHTVAVNRLIRDSLIFDKKLNQFPRIKTLRGFRDNRKIKYYGFAIDYLNKEWKKQDTALLKTPYQNITAKEKHYSSYEFLQPYNGKLYAIKTTLNEIPKIVSIDSLANEIVVAQIGWLNEPHFAISNGKICIVDQVPDPRWEQRSYSDIFIIDAENGKRKRLTKKQVYQAPSYSGKADKIVAQHIDNKGKYELHIIDAKSGKVQDKIPNPKNQFYFSPSWSSDDSRIVYIAQEKNQKSIKYYDLVTNEEHTLVEDNYEEMASLLWHNDTVYFTASYSGINNIYACNVNTKEITRLTSSRFGADYAAIMDEKLYYSNYTSDGYKPVKHIPSKIAGDKLSEVKNISLGLGDKLTALEGGVIDFSQTPNHNYEIKNYSRLANLFHIHSWFPGFTLYDTSSDEHSDNSEFYPNLTLLSQDKLSTSFLRASYNANPALSHERFKINYQYDGFYPKLGLDLAFGSFEKPLTEKIRDIIIRPYVSLPLKWKQGMHTIYFTNTLSGEYVNYNYLQTKKREDKFGWSATSSFTRARQRAKRDLFSPSLQSLSVGYLQEDIQSPSNKIAVAAKIYTPGIYKHHSLQLSANWQQKGLNSYNMLSNLPRGYNSKENTDLLYGSVDYYLPLAYPVWNIGTVLYIKRIAMGLYGDYALIKDGKTDNFWGTGGSLFLDMNVWRYEADIRLGLQAGVAHSRANGYSSPMNLIFQFSVF